MGLAGADGKANVEAIALFALLLGISSFSLFNLTTRPVACFPGDIGTLKCPLTSGGEVNGNNECFTGNFTCGEMILSPVPSANHNSTLCTQAAGHNCSPEVVSTSGVITGDRIIIVAVASLGTPTYTVTDTAGDAYTLVLTTGSNRIFISMNPIVNLPTSVTITFTGTNTVKYAAMEVSLSSASPSAGLTAIGGTAGGVVSAGSTTNNLPITTQAANSLLVDGVTLISGSCHDTVTSTANSIMSTVNVGCTNGNAAFVDGAQLTLSAGAYTSDYSWVNTATGSSWAIEVKGGISRGVDLYYDSEAQTSSTVVSPGSTTIRSGLVSAAFVGVIVETEGYVSSTALSAAQALTFSITGTGLSCSTLLIDSVVGVDSFAFSMKCSAVGASGVISLSYTAGGNDAQTTIVVNSFRLYGLR